jgi:hypothetical protein
MYYISCSNQYVYSTDLPILNNLAETMDHADIGIFTGCIIVYGSKHGCQAPTGLWRGQQGRAGGTGPGASGAAQEKQSPAPAEQATGPQGVGPIRSSDPEDDGKKNHTAETLSLSL